ncbi:MAG: hypothetical protein ABIH00_11510 [Armatimonadota bacterium]
MNITETKFIAQTQPQKSEWIRRFVLETTEFSKEEVKVCFNANKLQKIAYINKVTAGIMIYRYSPQNNKIEIEWIEYKLDGGKTRTKARYIKPKDKEYFINQLGKTIIAIEKHYLADKKNELIMDTLKETMEKIDK